MRVSFVCRAHFSHFSSSSLILLLLLFARLCSSFPSPFLFAPQDRDQSRAFYDKPRQKGKSRALNSARITRRHACTPCSPMVLREPSVLGATRRPSWRAKGFARSSARLTRLLRALFSPNSNSWRDGARKEMERKFLSSITEACPMKAKFSSHSALLLFTFVAEAHKNFQV